MSAPAASAPAAEPSGTPSSARPATHTQSALRTNLSYLVKGTKSELRPNSIATRSTLRSVRYLLKFVFWRLVRYFKYAAVAAGTAALAGTALGTALPWVAAIAVPSLPVAAAMGIATGVIKFGWRHSGVSSHFRKSWERGDGDARQDEHNDAEEAKTDFNRRTSRAQHAWSQEAFT